MFHLYQFLSCRSSRSNGKFLVELATVGRNDFSIESLRELYRRRRFPRCGRSGQYYEMLVVQNRDYLTGTGPFDLTSTGSVTSQITFRPSFSPSFFIN